MLKKVKVIKSINEDPLSYLIDLIIRLSKILTKGRGLTRNGVKAFLLFFLTGGLVYQHTILPTTVWDIVKLYWIPLIFLIYFFMDLGENIDKINNFFKKLSQKTDFIYESIMDGSISHNDLELYLMTLPFSYDQIINIIEKLVSDEQFTSSSQNSLLQNNAIYRVDTYSSIKESFTNPLIIDGSEVNVEWTSSAVCVFLKKTSGKLPKKYLNNLIEMYKEYPSVLVAIGFFHQYRLDKTDENGIIAKTDIQMEQKDLKTQINKDDTDIQMEHSDLKTQINKDDIAYFKIGYEFKYDNVLYNIFSKIFIILFAIFIIYSLLALNNIDKGNDDFYFVGLLALVLTGFKFISYVQRNEFIWSIKKHLKKYHFIDDDFVANKIINDLNKAMYDS